MVADNGIYCAGIPWLCSRRHGAVLATDNVQHDQELARIITWPVLRSLLRRRQDGEDVKVVVPKTNLVPHGVMHAALPSEPRITLEADHEYARQLLAAQPSRLCLELLKRFAPFPIQVIACNSLTKIFKNSIRLRDLAIGWLGL